MFLWRNLHSNKEIWKHQPVLVTRQRWAQQTQTILSVSLTPACAEEGRVQAYITIHEITRTSGASRLAASTTLSSQCQWQTVSDEGSTGTQASSTEELGWQTNLRHPCKMSALLASHLTKRPTVWVRWGPPFGSRQNSVWLSVHMFNLNHSFIVSFYFTRQAARDWSTQVEGDTRQSRTGPGPA